MQRRDVVPRGSRVQQRLVEVVERQITRCALQLERPVVLHCMHNYLK
jgi:hypothetical protein